MRRVKGYFRGSAIPIFVVSVQGYLVEIATAHVFAEMEARARKDGVELRLTSGWRSMKSQRNAYGERHDSKTGELTKAGKAKGPAARPGWSAHQSGRAIDIGTGMGREQYMAGNRTRIYKWLEKNAPAFGFAQTVSSEPWHWELVTSTEMRCEP